MAFLLLALAKHYLVLYRKQLTFEYCVIHLDILEAIQLNLVGVLFEYGEVGNLSRLNASQVIFHLHQLRDDGAVHQNFDLLIQEAHLSVVAEHLSGLLDFGGHPFFA